MLSEERDKKLKEIARMRQPDLTVILENVHDPHNIGAVMRTCDAVGIQDIHIIYTKESSNSEKMYVGKRASRGTKKWVNCHFHHSIKECLDIIQPKFKNIFATHLSATSKSLYECNLTDSVALVFGNERHGISDDLLSYCTANVLIPMVGMVQSLNISVAVAVSVYEAFRQRNKISLYDKSFDYKDDFMRNIYKEGVYITYPKIYETSPETLDNVADELGPK